jgi:hypothetical protein
MSERNEWEISQLIVTFREYIAGIEEPLRQPMMQAKAALIMQTDDVFEVINPIMRDILDDIAVDLPWEIEGD